MPIHRINVGRSFISKRLTSSVFKFELDGPEYGGVRLISCCGLGGIQGKVRCDMLKKNGNGYNSVIYWGDIDVANWKSCQIDLTMSVVTAAALISCSWLNGMVTFSFIDWLRL